MFAPKHNNWMLFNAMLYKFDILFKKELKGGGMKVVTYSHLLNDPEAFGQGESLEGTLGTLSLTDSEKEKGYSISTLFVKYRTQLVGYHWAGVFDKEFPLQFTFNQPDDVTSNHAELVDENGTHYSSDVQTIVVDGIKSIDLETFESFVALVPQTGECILSDGDSELKLHAGQLALVPASDDMVIIQGNSHVKSIRLVSKTEI